MKFRTWMASALSVLALGGWLLAQQPVAQGPQASNAAAWLTSVTTWAAGTLGAMANYGTSPGAVLVPGVNAYITNTPTVSFTPSTSSSIALSRYHASSAAAANIKASAGNLYGLVLGNNGTVPCYLQVFNNAGTPTAGTSVLDSYYVQAGVTVVVPATVFALTNYSTGIAAAGATTDGGATTTGCTTTFSVTAYYF